MHEAEFVMKKLGDEVRGKELPICVGLTMSKTGSPRRISSRVTIYDVTFTGITLAALLRIAYLGGKVEAEGAIRLLH